MTVERTRQLLGNKIAHLSDEEVLALIQRTEKALHPLFTLAVQKIKVDKRI